MWYRFLTKSIVAAYEDSTTFYFIIGYDDAYGIATIAPFLQIKLSQDKTKTWAQESLCSELKIQEKDCCLTFR